MTSNLPHTVEVWLQDVYDQLESDGFFNENDLAFLTKEESTEIFREIIGGAALNVWMDSGDVNLSPDDLTRLLALERALNHNHGTNAITLFSTYRRNIFN